MLKGKNIKMLLGLGILLAPSMVFGETSAQVTTEVVSVINESKEIQGTANIDYLNIRSYPDVQGSTVIGQLRIGEQVRIVNKVNNFYKVHVNGQPGFVYAPYIDCIEGLTIEEATLEGVTDLVTGDCRVKAKEATKQTETSLVTTKGNEIVTKAMNYLGTPYVYGGSSLTNGVDCSGFTQGVMKLVGIHIPRTSKQQSQTGILVSKDQIQPGDLLFFGYSKSSIFHTGIYIGEGKMIHSSTAKSGGVIVANAYNGGGAPLQLIRRVHNML